METTTFDWSCKNTWKQSAKNTAWCLLGCAIGDFGTIFFFQLTEMPANFTLFRIQILIFLRETTQNDHNRLLYKFENDQ